MLCSRLGISTGTSYYSRQQAAFPTKLHSSSGVCRVVFSFSIVGVVRGKAEVKGKGRVDMHGQ